MRALNGAILLLAFGAPLSAAPDIRFPVAPPSPAPAPIADVSRLTGEQWYVIDSDAPLIVLASPRGVVSVTEETGPIRLRGKFVDGNGKVESRTFNGKHVYVVEAVSTGRVELLVFPVGAAKEADVIRKTIDVDAGQGPIPPPKPTPPKPDPKPDPVVKVERVWVVVVEDALAPRTLDTAKALNDPFWAALKPKHDWRHYLSDSKTAVENGYVEQAKKVGYPAVLVLNAADGDVLRAFKLASVAGIDAAVKEVSK